MIEQSETQDREWRALLTHSYGEAEPRTGLKAGLLLKLKQRLAEIRENAEEADASEEGNWQRLLTAAYVPCRPETGFQTRLLDQLKARQAATCENVEQGDASEEGNWRRLLTAAYVPCRPETGFQTRLLDQLKARQAATCENVEQIDASEEGNWRRLLTAAYVPCRPEADFQARLLAQLKTRQTTVAAPTVAEPGEEAIRTILAKTYVPVGARKEFQRRLLGNLKERQRHSTATRRSSRRRTIFMSSLSSLAAAAMVTFVVWTIPMRGDASPETPSASPAMPQSLFATMPALSVPATSTLSQGIASPVSRGLVFASDVTGGGSVSPAVAVAPAVSRLASAGSYRVTDAFSRSPLPGTVRGIGMEVNDGAGWQPMGETLIASLKPGMAFRPAADSAGAVGLGFGDGSTVLMCSDAEMEATDNGFSVRRGTLAVTVPEGSEDRFRLHFPERDIAVEPGTMLAVTVPPAEKYADGGAPAPVVRVADGGMALARGSNGIGPLLACQVYNIDNYVTPELPGRPICASEWEDLDRNLRARQPGEGNMLASLGGGFAANRMVSNVRSGTRGSSPVPAGFVKKGSRWLADTYDGQPTVKIQYLSDDYFGLANERRDLAAGLSLGSDVVLDGGDGVFYEIQR